MEVREERKTLREKTDIVIGCGLLARVEQIDELLVFSLRLSQFVLQLVDQLLRRFSSLL